MKVEIVQETNGKWSVVITTAAGKMSPLGMIWLETREEAERKAATIAPPWVM